VSARPLPASQQIASTNSNNQRTKFLTKPTQNAGTIEEEKTNTSSEINNSHQHPHDMVLNQSAGLN
jgi:hypothetical protein